MKNSIFKIMAITVLLSMAGCSGNNNPENWSSDKLDKWFEDAGWLNGWQVKPGPSTDKKAFADSYFKNRERWDKAFSFLKSNDLSKLELKRYDIEGDSLYAMVSEYLTKNEEDARFEAHQKYIDIQYVVSGQEMIGVASVSQKKDVLEPYDPVKDIEFMTVNDGVNLKATPATFFVFFPENLHRPGLKIEANEQVRKVVVKVKI